MSDNPLEPSRERDNRIRERAYHLWEADGRPNGRAEEFWERARELIAIEDTPVSREMPVGPGGDSLVHETRADEASLQDNLGEFPGRMTDQGERRQTPMTRAQLRNAGGTA
jgi:hypothetical protein